MFATPLDLSRRQVWLKRTSDLKDSKMSSKSLTITYDDTQATQWYEGSSISSSLAPPM